MGQGRVTLSEAGVLVGATGVVLDGTGVSPWKTGVEHTVLLGVGDAGAILDETEEVIGGEEWF